MRCRIESTLSETDGNKCSYELICMHTGIGEHIAVLFLYQQYLASTRYIQCTYAFPYTYTRIYILIYLSWH